MPPKAKSFGIEIFPQSWSWLAVVVRWWKMKNWPHVHQHTPLWEQQKWNWVSNMKGKGPTAAESTQRWQRGWGKLGVARIWVSTTSPIICSFAFKCLNNCRQGSSAYYCLYFPSTFDGTWIISKWWIISKSTLSKSLKNCYRICLRLCYRIQCCLISSSWKWGLLLNLFFLYSPRVAAFWPQYGPSRILLAWQRCLLRD